MKGEEKNNSGEQKIALNSFFSYASDLRTGEKKVFQDVFFLFICKSAPLLHDPI